MWNKLKKEWKTALAATLGVIVGAHDAIIAAGYAPEDFAPIIPEEYRPYTTLVFGLVMLGLRKWNDSVNNR
jgi:hypothetical protein